MNLKTEMQFLPDLVQKMVNHVDVVVQFYPWFNFYFLLFLGMVMYDNDL